MRYLLGGILLVLTGLVMLLRPELFYELTEAWKHTSGGPSNRYLSSIRFGGIMCCLAGFLGLFLPLLCD